MLQACPTRDTITATAIIGALREAARCHGPQ